METIESACELVTDGTHYTPKDVGDGIPFLTVKDVSEAGLDFVNCSYITESDYREAASGNSAPKRGDVLFSKDGTVGKVHVVDSDKQFAVLSSLAILRPKKGAVDPAYLGHALRSPTTLDEALKKKTGSAIRRIILSDLKRVRIFLPTLPEQRRIAAILDQADALRAKRREALSQLDSLTQSIFIEMFGDPATNPKGFPRKTLGEIIKFEGGSQPPASTFTDNETPETIRLVQIRDFKTDRFKTFIPRKLSRRFFEEDDVMIGRYGPPVFQILRGLSGSYNVALMKAVPREGIAKDFIFHLLKEKRLHKFVVANSERTAGQSGVNLELLEKYEAYIPPIDVQQRFVKTVSTVDAMTAVMRESLVQLDAFFASLQHRAFRGEL